VYCISNSVRCVSSSLRQCDGSFNKKLSQDVFFLDFIKRAAFAVINMFHNFSAKLHY